MPMVRVSCDPRVADAVEETFDEVNAAGSAPVLSVSHEDVGLYFVRGDADALLTLSCALSGHMGVWSVQRVRA